MRTSILVLSTVLAFGCSSGSPGMGSPPGSPPGTPPPAQTAGYYAMVSVSGKLVDFETGMDLTGGGSVSTHGVSPTPTVNMSGADFLLGDVQPNSVFYLIASSPPDYRSTYQPVITVAASDVTGVSAAVPKVSYVASLLAAFNVTEAPNTAIIMLRAVDAAGHPLAGVPAAALPVAGAKGPLFLDAKLQAAPAATATSASGLALYVGVQPGVIELPASAGGYQLVVPAVPAAAGLVSLADVTVTTAATMPPPGNTNVSFATQVVPIFARRGCTNCHSGNGPGRDLGSLTLDASVIIDYRQLTEAISPIYGTTRVNLKDPAKSLVLTMPGYENPPDPHPTVVFATTADPDYQLLLTWIKQGAQDN